MEHEHLKLKDRLFCMIVCMHAIEFLPTQSYHVFDFQFHRIKCMHQ